MTTYVAKPRQARPQRPPERQRPRRPRDPLWAKICLILGAVVMIASGAFVVVPKVLANYATKDIPIEDLIPEEEKGANIEGPINMLLLGMDERSGNSSDLIRSDTIIIVHIPATHDRVYMVSIPRDAEVEIPAFPETNFGGETTKVNAAFAHGAVDSNGKPDNTAAGRKRGAKLAIKTLSRLVPGGLKFNAVGIINFVGFRDILKAIGGVHLCVDIETRSIHYDNKGKYHTNDVPYAQRKIYKPGCRDFKDWEALDFARQRHFDNGDGDYTRQRHQQQLLMAIFKKLSSAGTMTDVGQLTKLQKAAGTLLTLDLGGQAVDNWIFTLKSVRAEDVVMIKTNGGKITPTFSNNGNERFSDESLDLLKSVHDDTVFDFLASHPSWIAKEK